MRKDIKMICSCLLVFVLLSCTVAVFTASGEAGNVLEGESKSFHFGGLIPDDPSDLIDHELPGSAVYLKSDEDILDFFRSRGDIDGNGKISASDARQALRISAKLTNPDERQSKAGDIFRIGKIDAAAARKILRVSAKLDTFPEVVLVLNVGEKYTISFSEGILYTWKYSVKQETGIDVDCTEIPLPSGSNPGTPSEKLVTLTAQNSGIYNITLKLDDSHISHVPGSEDHCIEEYQFTIIVL